MKSIINQGLKITTNCNYLKFTSSKYLEIIEDKDRSVFEIKIPNNFRSSDIIHRSISLIYDCILSPTDYIKIQDIIVDINGCKFKKLTQNIINFSQFLVGDIDDFIVYNDDYKIILLIPEKRADDICTYIKCIESLYQFELIDYSELAGLANLYNLNIDLKDIRIDSNNGFVFNTKNYYDNYILRMIDVVESFITQLETRLESYGIQLIGVPVDETTLTNNNIKYRVTDLGDQVSHKSYNDKLRYAVQHRTNIEFELTTPNFILYNDFKTKYQNIDLISNFTEFYTKDKIGRDWISAVNWQEIETNFTQDYQTNQDGNFSFTANFTCELYYYVVFDKTYPTIKEIILSIVSNNDDINKYLNIIK